MKELKSLMDALECQSSLYKPSLFWEKASNKIVEDLNNYGLEAFRSLPSALNFFVPTYGYPGNALSEEITSAFCNWQNSFMLTGKQNAFISNFITGYSGALADYRTLSASEYLSSAEPRLMDFSESDIGKPVEHFEIEGNFYSRSSLNYLLGLSFIKKHINFSEIKTIMEVGGGFGTLGEIVNKILPSLKYINIDIPPTLMLSSYYLSKIIDDGNVTTYDHLKNRENDAIKINDLNKISNLPSWEIENLKGKIDLFVNFISFQEMEPDIVKNYLKQVERLGADWILLRNMREGKQKASNNSIGVNTPLKSFDYLKMLDEYCLVDSNVMPYGFKTVDGYHSEIMLLKRNK